MCTWQGEKELNHKMQFGDVRTSDAQQITSKLCKGSIFHGCFHHTLSNAARARLQNLRWRGLPMAAMHSIGTTSRRLYLMFEAVIEDQTPAGADRKPFCLHLREVNPKNPAQKKQCP